MARIRLFNGVPCFFCLACQAVHKLDTRFRYNYNPNLPSFKGQISLQVGPFGPGHIHEGKVIACSFTITKGVIVYGETSTHAHAGKELGLPDFDEMEALRRAQIESRASMPQARPD